MIAFSRTQTGNALFLILIAVVLFGALSFAIMRSSTGSASSSDKYQVQYAQVMSNISGISGEFQKLILRGCALEDIDIAWQPLTSVALDPGQNAECILFNTRGGAAPVIIGPNGNPSYWVSLWDIQHVGTNGQQDVIVGVDLVEERLDDPNFCQYVNTTYTIPSVETAAFAANRTNKHLNFPDSAPFSFTADYDAKTTACFYSSAEAMHMVYSVIQSR